MRASLTLSEQVLWARIRGRRLGSVFRRQVPLLGRFIADFLAPAQRRAARKKAAIRSLAWAISAGSS